MGQTVCAVHELRAENLLVGMGRFGAKMALPRGQTLDVNETAKGRHHLKHLATHLQAMCRSLSFSFRQVCRHQERDPFVVSDGRMRVPSLGHVDGAQHIGRADDALVVLDVPEEVKNARRGHL